MKDTFAFSRQVSIEEGGVTRAIGALHVRVEPDRLSTMTAEIFDAQAWTAHAAQAAEQIAVFRELAQAFALEHGGVLL